MDTKPGPAYRRFKLKPGGETPNFAADLDRIITPSARREWVNRQRLGKRAASSSAKRACRGAHFGQQRANTRVEVLLCGNL